MAEETLFAALSVDNVRRHVTTIVTEIPSRLAGSDNGRRMAEYSAKAMVEAGADECQIHELPAIVSFPEAAELRVLAPEVRTIQANTLGHSLATTPRGVEGDLMDVGSGAFADYEGQNPLGAISMSELSYSPARHEKQRIAGLMGCSAAVMMNWGPPDNDALPFGSVKPAWGTPTPDALQNQMPTLPCVGIARTDGLMLRDWLAKGPVRVWLRTRVENPWCPVQITTAELKGRSDDFVVVGGHQDSWPGEAATDNAAGNACMYELARVFAPLKDQLRRGLVFGCWTAHETGTMAGSAWFVDQNWDRLRRHMVAYLQIDQPACVGTSRWGTSSNAELKAFHQGIEQRLLNGMPHYWRRAAKNGDSSFFGLGVPMLHGEGSFTEQELRQTANANLGWWHHSLHNTLDKLDWDFMATHLRIYAAYLWELCTAPVLPFEFATVADQVIERLETLAPFGADVGLDETLGCARAFRGAAARLAQTADAQRALYRAQPHRDEAAAERLNEAMKRLSRLLVPLQSTAVGTYGHDPYGYTPQTTMIPCLYDLPRLAGLPDGPERWSLAVQLRRERNRVTDALVDASRVVDEALETLNS